MRKTVTAAIFVFILAACGAEGEGTVQSDESSYAVDDDGEASTARAGGAEGEDVAINVGEDVDASLPEGFSVYPGATVGMSAAMSGGRSAYSLTSNGSSADVIAHYRREALAAGFEIEMEGRSGETRIMNARKDDRNVMVQSTADGAGSDTLLSFQNE